MNPTLTEHMYGYCEGQRRLLKYPVDNELIKQRKCRTQALKLLLSMPPVSMKETSRTWRLVYIIADILSYLQVKPVGAK